jgi:hypothetical protein
MSKAERAIAIPIARRERPLPIRSSVQNGGREIGIPEGVGPCQGGGGRVCVQVAGDGACVRAGVVGGLGSRLAAGHPAGAWP